MNGAVFIYEYAAYNRWANQQVVAWLKTKPADLMERETPSSFPSLKQTLTHIWDTQKWWCDVMQQAPTEAHYGRIFPGTMEELFDGLEQHSAEFAVLAASLSESALEETCTFSIPYVGEFTRPRFEMIVHCVSHSTYHRGQLVTMGRSLGFTDAPMTDYMFYLLMAKQS